MTPERAKAIVLKVRPDWCEKDTGKGYALPFCPHPPTWYGTWLSALSSLAHSDPEAVVKARWPEAFKRMVNDGWEIVDGVRRNHNGYFGFDVIGEGETIEAAWQSAALHVVEEIKKEE